MTVFWLADVIAVTIYLVQASMYVSLTASVFSIVIAIHTVVFTINNYVNIMFSCICILTFESVNMSSTVISVDSTAAVEDSRLTVLCTGYFCIYYLWQ